MQIFVRTTLFCAGFILPATAATYAVKAGESLQAVLNSALPGDTITIQAGATFVGNFILPNKGGAGTIRIESSAIGNLPSGRVSPADAVNMPRLITPNSAAALAAGPGAHDYVIAGIELTAAANVYAWTIVQLGAGTEKTVAELPYNITVDRCFVHGDPAVGGKRGIGLNSRSTSVLNSWVSDFKSATQDTQGVGGINGPGPFEIINNHIEATGENIMFGGGTPAIVGLIPSDINIKRNTLSKPLSWKLGSPGYAGTAWLIKNLFELKNGQRVYLDGNLLENCWAGAQNGAAIVLTVSTEGGASSWAVVQDVHITNNIIRHVGVGIAGHARDAKGGKGQRFVIRNNVFEDIDPVNWGGTGTFMLLNAGVPGVVVEHNTLFAPNFGLYFGQKMSPGVLYKNNISTGRLCSDGLGCGTSIVQASGAGADFTGNLLVGLPGASNPVGNWFPAAVSNVGFTSAATSDYSLASNSIYRNMATDGTDPGVNMAALRAAMVTDAGAGGILLVLSPSTATLTRNQTLQLTASVIGTGNTAVAWTYSPSIGTLSPTGTYTAPASIASVQTITVVATSVADPTKSATAILTLNPPPPVVAGASGTAGFLKSDIVTRGTWKGVYGADGVIIANSSNSTPAYATVSITGATLHTWAASTTTDTRALQKAAAADRIASAWYSTTSFDINVNFTDGKAHRVGVYCLDFVAAGRKQNVDVIDAATGTLLDRQAVSNFVNGTYLFWEITGRVIIRVTNTGAFNGMISGIFFDPASLAPPPVSATFVQADTTTRGTWKGVYGAEGYSIVNDSSSYPAYATVNVTGATPHLWAATTADTRAPQKGAAMDRIASAWFSATSFDIKVNLTDGNAHRIALYCLDYTSYGRKQNVDVIDAVTGVLLNRQAVSNFGNGAYLVWNVTGNVIFRVTSTGPMNAVVSGLFFQ